MGAGLGAEFAVAFGLLSAGEQGFGGQAVQRGASPAAVPTPGRVMMVASRRACSRCSARRAGVVSAMAQRHPQTARVRLP